MTEVRKVPTMRDIAQEAGVSAMTVSNVINERPKKVSADTIDRVRAAMDKLGFVRNASASALKSKRSDIIALIYPSTLEPLANQHDAAFVGAVERAVRQVRGGKRHLMIRAAEDVVRTVDDLRSWRVDGAVVYGTFGPEVDALLRRRLEVPIVFVDNYSESAKVSRVGIADRAGGRLAAEHLLDQGHRTLGFVGPLAGHEVGVVRERYRGFLEAVEAAGARVERVEEIECPARFDDGQNKAAELSGRSDRPTGLFATADILAIGLLKGFQRNGVVVPDHVSLVGFDDIPEATHGLLELTTIRQDVAKKAHQAIDVLDGLIIDSDAGTQVTLGVELVRRQSVDQPPHR